MSKDTDRHSHAIRTAEHQPLTDEERAPIEAQNALRQFDRLMDLVDDNLKGIRQGQAAIPVKTSVLMELNRLAVEKIIANPGAYRQTPMLIGKSKHQPPAWEEVPEHVDEMCEYVAQNWGRSAIHLAAYLLWRVNWIHPFSDGNGRTARAISYLVLCVRLRQRLPGDRTMPDFIADEKTPYYSGLEAADGAFAKGKIDVGVLERYLRKLLTQQVERAASEGMQTAAPVPTATQLKRDGEAIAEALSDNSHARATRRAPWITAGAVVAGALISAAVVIGRCGKETRCVVGRQESCMCADGNVGVQVCEHDGLRFGKCQCGVPTGVLPAQDAGSVDAPSADASLSQDAGQPTP